MRKALIGLIGLSFCFVQAALAWQVTLSGSPDSDNFAYAVKADAQGNVIAGGRLFNGATEEDFTVVKFDGSTGEELWRVRIYGSFNGRDQVNALAVDAQGDVIAAGRILNRFTSWDFFVVKLDGMTGTELWRVAINGSANRGDDARAVTLDSQGNAIVVGEIRNIDTGYDFAVVKLNGQTGTELWRAEINGSYPLSDDMGNAVALDAQDDVIAAGRMRNVGRVYDFGVVKLNGKTGEVLWRADIDGGAGNSDWADVLAIDSEGNAIAAGVLWSGGTAEDFGVVKLDGKTGEEIWRKAIDGNYHIVDKGLSVAVDGGGNVIAGGFIYNIGTEQDFLVIKLDGKTGWELWRKELNGSNNMRDHAMVVAVDKNGNIIAGGFVNNIGTSEDMVIIKLDGTEGKELVYREINGRANGPDALQAMTLDGQGDVMVVGYMATVPSFLKGVYRDFAVIKLRGKDLSDF